MSTSVTVTISPVQGPKGRNVAEELAKAIQEAVSGVFVANGIEASTEAMAWHETRTRTENRLFLSDHPFHDWSDCIQVRGECWYHVKEE